MASRKQAPDDEEQSAPKRQRTQENNAVVAAPPASLDTVNDDCLVQILSFLSIEDLNNKVSFCCQRFREARSHESLNQTRTATLVISEGTTIGSFFDRIASQGWNESLQRHFTHLKIMGLERLWGFPRRLSAYAHCELSGITSLDATSNRVGDNRHGNFVSGSNLSSIFPNLEQIDLSHTKMRPRSFVSPKELCSDLCKKCDNLTRLAWNGVEGLSLDGEQFSDSASLTELHVDDCCFHSRDEEAEHVTELLYSDMAHQDDRHYLFGRFSRLERLSIKNATWMKNTSIDFFDGPPNNPRPVSQAMLVKMVRRHPTLRWLRSDLTEKNIAMLKRERPEITFVSE